MNLHGVASVAFHLGQYECSGLYCAFVTALTQISTRWDLPGASRAAMSLSSVSSGAA